MNEQEQATEQAIPPQKQAVNLRAGDGGIVPPVEHRWRPGVSGNPGGRPKGASLVAAFRRALTLSEGKLESLIADKGAAMVDRVGARHVHTLLNGDIADVPAFLRLAYERSDGMAPAHLEVSHDIGKTVTVRAGEHAIPELLGEGEALATNCPMCADPTYTEPHACIAPDVSTDDSTA